MPENSNNKSLNKMEGAIPLGWGIASFAATGGACWYFTQKQDISIQVGGCAAVLILLSCFHFWWMERRRFAFELQTFLLRCRALPEDFKPIRWSALLNPGGARKRLMDAGAAFIQENFKKQVETRHLLDKFVGTRGSQFATQTGIKAVWEGELTQAIVLFSDVRGFTNMTQKLLPQETVRFLNRMFTDLEEIITFSGGEINKYMGDAILAFFPVGKDNPEPSAKKALQAALRMQDAFHQQQGTFGEHYSAAAATGLGVGMALGQVIIGNLGSARRMEFTLIGDTVNLASRLCSVADDGQILINEDLASCILPSFRMEQLSPIKLKGISQAHAPYSVMGEKIQQGLA